MAMITDQYQRLMNFMDGNMSLNEMASFENELINNPELRAQLDFEQSVRDNIRDTKNIAGESDVQQNIFTIHKNKSFSFKPQGIKLMAAAIIPIVIIGGIAMLLVHKKNIPSSISATFDSSQINKTIVLEPVKKPAEVPAHKININADSLFKKYYKKEPVPDEYPVLLADAFEGYAKNNYLPLDKLNAQDMDAVRGVNDSENRNTILLLSIFYKGIAAVERKKTSQALQYFSWVINNSKDVDWKDKAHWYTAMVFLQDGDIERVQRQLHQISKNGKYNLMAKQILKTIDSN